MTPKKILMVGLVVVCIAAYIVGSFWIIGIIQGNKTLPFIPQQNTAAATTTLPQTYLPGGNQTTTHLPIATPTPKPTPTPTPTPTPIPTPTPLQGPGAWACDPIGICNNYSNDMRKSCPRTFADPQCLGMCGTPAVRCPQ